MIYTVFGDSKKQQQYRDVLEAFDIGGQELIDAVEKADTDVLEAVHTHLESKGE